MNNDCLEQIIGELEYLVCYRCTHDVNGSSYDRPRHIQEKACSRCSLIKLEARLAEQGIMPFEKFDFDLAKKSIN